MKKFIFLLFLASTFMVTQAQTAALQDAIALRKYNPQESEDLLNFSDSTKAVAEILGKYATASNQDVAGVTEYFEQNPYIRISKNAAQSNNETLNSSSLINAKSFSSLDVTNLALGMSDFLIKRAKTELNTAFFRRFREELNKPENKALALLFPHTVKLLNLINTEIYQYDLYLNNLRAAFQEDLDEVYANLPGLLKYYKSDIDKVGKGTYEFTALGLRALELNKNGNHGGELISQLLRDNRYTELQAIYPAANHPKESDALNAILLLNMFAESLEDQDNKGAYLKQTELAKLKDPKTLKIYLGLLYEVAKKEPYQNVSFSKGIVNVESLLKEIASKQEVFAQFHTNLKELMAQAKDVEHTYQRLADLKVSLRANTEMTQKQKNLQLFQASNQLYTEVIQLLKVSEQLDETLGLEATLTEVNKLIEVMENFGALSNAIAGKQYAKVATQTAFLLQDLLVKNESVSNITRNFLKYSSFMAALVDAESPEAAQNALEAAALPTGSYTIKRVSKFNVALNGYIGGFAGHEITKGVSEGNGINNLAITAPVGISMSWGNWTLFGLTKKQKSSFGFFIPMVDLGSVASYRLDNPEEVESIPSIQLGDLFAPGAFMEIGIGSTPLTLGFGAQLGSRLRDIQPGEDANDIGDSYWRYGVTLKVDIPLMQFVAIPAKRTH